MKALRFAHWATNVPHTGVTSFGLGTNASATGESTLTCCSFASRRACPSACVNRTGHARAQSGLTVIVLAGGSMQERTLVIKPLQNARHLHVHDTWTTVRMQAYHGWKRHPLDNCDTLRMRCGQVEVYMQTQGRPLLQSSSHSLRRLRAPKSIKGQSVADDRHRQGAVEFELAADCSAKSTWRYEQHQGKTSQARLPRDYRARAPGCVISPGAVALRNSALHAPRQCRAPAPRSPARPACQARVASRTGIAPWRRPRSGRSCRPKWLGR